MCEPKGVPPRRTNPLPRREGREYEPLGDRTRRRAGHYPLVQLTLARILEFVREPEAVFWVFIFPVLLALALGIAFRSQPPDKIPVGVDSRLPGAERILEALSHFPDLEPVPGSGEALSRQMSAGKIELIVAPCDRLSGGADPEAPDLGPPGPSPFCYVYDPARPGGRMARLAADEALQRSMGRKDVIRIQDRRVAETGRRYIDFLIPGLIGLNLMASGMWGVGFNVVDTRTKKLLKLLTATPMRRSHFLLGFMLSRLIFLVLEVIALVGFGWVVFGVVVQGSLLSLAVILLAGAMTFAGMGLLVAARPKSIEGVSGWMNLVMLPMWLLSGSFFSYSRFPEVMHPFIRALPLTALNDALRSVMNEGSPLLRSAAELGVLLAWGGMSFAVALKIFRWK
jgi:ABC-type multidrug transport system permease subunit